MKRITIVLLLIAVTYTAYCQETTLIDFGVGVQTTSGNWNNFTVQNVVSTSINLIDINGFSTGEVLTLTDNFDLYNRNSEGTQTSGATFGGATLPITASRDSFFGESVAFDNGGGPSTETTGGFTLSGLEGGKYYSFNIFASRTGPDVTDNRETLYTINGNASAQTATLDVAQNTSNVATILNIQPNGSGEISIQATTGPSNTNEFGFYYLGAIEMTKTDATLSNNVFVINGLVTIYPNPSSEFVKISLNLIESAKIKMDVYGVSGKLVKRLLNEEKSTGAFVETWNTSNVDSGVYILKIDVNGRTYNSKLILK